MTDKPWWDKILIVGDVHVIAENIGDDWWVGVIDPATGFSNGSTAMVDKKYIREIRDMLEVLIDS